MTAVVIPDTAGHTFRDHHELTAAGIDPLVTQPREHDVQCITCYRRTWHSAGYCDFHYQPPAALTRPNVPVASPLQRKVWEACELIGELRFVLSPEGAARKLSTTGNTEMSVVVEARDIAARLSAVLTAEVAS